MTTALVSSMDLAKSSRGARREPTASASWGLPWLERHLPPPVPGSLTVLAAGTNVGKTFATLMLARGQAEHGPVVYYSLEDPPREIGRRLDAGLAHPNLFVVFPERNHLSEILASVESLFGGAAPPRFVWVDYLQIIAYDAEIQAWSKADAVSRTTAELKATAKRMGVPLGLNSQLRRVGPEEAGAFPTIHLIKESGDVENMADVILLLGGKPRSEYVTMEISKAKNAPVGERMRFRRGPGGVLVPANEDREGDEADARF
jgi:replicative DNA helicase